MAGVFSHPLYGARTPSSTGPGLYFPLRSGFLKHISTVAAAHISGNALHHNPQLKLQLRGSKSGRNPLRDLHQSWLQVPSKEPTAAVLLAGLTQAFLHTSGLSAELAWDAR